jgi:ATP-dependent Clp protease protease subunit
VLKIKENLVKMYASQTGQTEDQIVRDLDRDNFMSAAKAKEYGLIDQVIEVEDLK